MPKGATRRMTFISQAESTLRLLDRFLTQLSSMISEQSNLIPHPGRRCIPPLLDQMKHAQAVVEARRRDLQGSIDDCSAGTFIHELWSLAGDMAHFDFELGHLQGAEDYLRLREELSLKALTLTKELGDVADKESFLVEFAKRRR